MFKFGTDMGRDFPLVFCDVCEKMIFDFRNDLVSGTRGSFSAPGNVVFHHKGCATTEPLHTTILEFFGMLLTRATIGTRSSDGGHDRSTVEITSGTGFHA